jgi:hypothetical protein
MKGRFMNVKAESWVAWLGATAVAAVTGTFVFMSFAYGQFETREHAKERIDLLQARLDAIDAKLDRLLGAELIAPRAVPIKGNSRKRDSDSM